MRKIMVTGVIIAASLGLAACGDTAPAPAETATEELPVEETPAPVDSTAMPTDDAAMPTDGAMAKGAEAEADAPAGGAPSSSTGGRVTPPGQ